jgi:hypothetical protein
MAMLVKELCPSGNNKVLIIMTPSFLIKFILICDNCSVF